MDAIKNFLPEKTRVRRNGNVDTIIASELVPGDVVYLKLGDKVPADCRIIHAEDLKVDNSSLTGESDAQRRTVENLEQNPLEVRHQRACLAQARH